ncbi:DUF2812 domain-containing protein [Solibacillus sp. FSL K6-1523]|uniref:DUF2812 domain-containing protein n=1 Tax=Solibacillus sp. FSL K6-1523 TaxID=2921471 RepID=UPI0030FAA828
MRQTKYISSGGLAFSEDKDMEKLRRFSLKGSHVSHFSLMGYTLEKGESCDYIYSIDYRSLKEDDAEEYYELFSSFGWSHIVSDAGIHLFRAHPGTKPIYTDRDTTAEKYGNSINSMNKFAIPLVLLNGLVWFGALFSSGTLKSVLYVVALILNVIVLPTIWTVLTTYTNKWKVEGRVRLVNLVKSLLFLLLAIAVIVLLFVKDSSVYMFASMVIGAITLPTAIWVIMSLYQKVEKKRA